MNKILVVDDDRHIRQLIGKFLGEQGYRVTLATNGVEAYKLIEEEDFNLAVIDIMMPNMDGFELVEKIRASYELPVIYLTAKAQIEDKEKGFSLGIDDYLIKPFELKELLFRIKALLRRTNQNSEMTIEFDSFIIDRTTYEVELNGNNLLLPLKEFELLYTLAANDGRVLSREQLINQVWGSQYDGNDRTVDVHIKRLRERLAPLTNNVTIKTVRGVGYSLEISE